MFLTGFPEWLQMVKSAPEAQETWVREDTVEKGNGYLSIPARRIPQTEEPCESTVHGAAKSPT